MSSFGIIINAVFYLATLLFLLRFLLQASEANFYNPISQAVVKGSDLICKPLRAVLPGTGKFDLASVLVAWLISMLSIATLAYLAGVGWPTPVDFAVQGAVKTLLALTQFYKFTIIIMVFASFIAPGGQNPALMLIRQLVDPVMAPIRRVLPSLGGFDFSPMVVFLAIIVLEDFLVRTLL